jgi:hypothetical protein
VTERKIIASSTQPAGKQPMRSLSESGLRLPEHVSHQLYCHTYPVQSTLIIGRYVHLPALLQFRDPGLTNTNYAFRYCKPLNVASRVAESVVPNMDERTPLAASADPQFLVQVPATDQTALRRSVTETTYQKRGQDITSLGSRAQIRGVAIWALNVIRPNVLPQSEEATGPTAARNWQEHGPKSLSPAGIPSRFRLHFRRRGNNSAETKASNPFRPNSAQEAKHASEFVMATNVQKRGFVTSATNIRPVPVTTTGCKCKAFPHTDPEIYDVSSSQIHGSESI